MNNSFWHGGRNKPPLLLFEISLKYLKPWLVTSVYNCWYIKYVGYKWRMRVIRYTMRTHLVPMLTEYIHCNRKARVPCWFWREPIHHCTQRPPCTHSGKSPQVSPHRYDVSMCSFSRRAGWCIAEKSVIHWVHRLYLYW